MKHFLACALLASLTQARSRKDDGKCHVLAIGAGNDIGPYQAGVIWSLAQNKTEYDFISGVGPVGGLTAQFIATYEKDQLAQAAEDLENLWIEIASLKQERTGHFAFTWFFKKSLYKSGPMMKLLDRTFKDREMKQKVLVGLMNL